MMSAQHADLAVMHRLLYCHLWTDLGDWVRAVGELADLSDAEIERVVRPTKDLSQPDARSEDLKAENT
jgi:hypothetical protein